MEKQTEAEIAAICAGTPTLKAFDARGLVVREARYHRRAADKKLAESHITHHRYNAAGRLARSLDSRLSALQGPAFSNLSTSYSLSGKPLRTDSVDAGWQAHGFGAAGERLWTVDSRGTATHIEYDQQLRPIAVYERLADEEEHEEKRGRCIERYCYGDLTADAQRNQRGKLLRQDDGAGTLLIERYALTGGIQAQTRHFLKDASTLDLDWSATKVGGNTLWESGEGFRTRTEYSALGEPLCVTDACDHQRHYHYNIAGQLDTCSLQLQNARMPMVVATEMQYAAHGALLQEKAGNGTFTKHIYNPAHLRLIQSQTIHSDDTLLQDIAYEYDPVGNIMQICDAIQATRCQSNQEIKPVCTYQYDSLYQLIKASGRESISNTFPQALLPEAQVPLIKDATLLRKYTRTYTYDASGNLIKLEHTGHQDYTQEMQIAQDSNRAIIEMKGAKLEGSFDAQGNLLKLQPYGQDLVWNGCNQLQLVPLVTREGEALNDEERYAYDAQGQRLRKLRVTKAQKLIHQEDVRYLPGLEYRQNTATQETLQVLTMQAGKVSIRVLYWEEGKPVEIENGRISYSFADHLGSATLELDQAGKKLSFEEYYPFGGTAVWTAKSQVEAKYKYVRYSGKERDATGLYYYGFRYYAPWLHRWLNPDPAGTIDGLNLYRMVKNNPVVYVDPYGKQRKKVSNKPRQVHNQSQQPRGEVYRDEAAFREAITPLINKKATSEGVSSGKYYGKADKKNISVAWRIYQAALHANPIFLLGRLNAGQPYDDEHERYGAQIPNTFITKTLLKNVGRITDDETKMVKNGFGGILKSKEWSPLVNDALILGAIHSAKDISFASKRGKGNVWIPNKQRKKDGVWEPNQIPLVVMGRELIAVHASGRYEFVTSGDHGNLLGDVAMFNHSDDHRLFGFKEYLGAVQHYLGNKKSLEKLWNTPATPVH